MIFGDKGKRQHYVDKLIRGPFKKVMQYVAYFCLFLYDIVMFLISENLIQSAYRKIQIKLIGPYRDFMFLSNHRMAAKVSWPRKPLLEIK